MTDDLTIQLSGADWLGVVLAAVAAFVVGFVWFTFLFGKRWAKEMGFEDMEQPDGKTMGLNMAKDLVGHLVMAYVLFHAMVVWIPSVWGAHFQIQTEDSSMFFYGLSAAGFSWLGFFLPGALSRTGWEGRSWAWFGIDAGYSLTKLVVMGLILAAFQ